MSNLDALLVVVRRMGSLRERAVFVGGAVRGLLITDAAAAPERPTDDVDAIVSVSSRVEYYQLADELRARGFLEDASDGAPVCRWLVAGVRLDVMPDEGGVLSFRNRWYTGALAHAIQVTVQGDAASQARLPLVKRRLAALTVRR